MAKLKRSDLLSADASPSEREAFRTRSAAHQRSRKIGLGEHVILQFEDHLTVQHRLQEWLWVLQSSEAAVLRTQIAQCKALIPDGSDLKATWRFTYTESAQHTLALANLKGIEARIYGEVEGLGRSFAIAEQVALQDHTGEAHNVQFLRFQFNEEQIMAVRAGAEFGFGIDDDRMRVAHTLKRQSRAALLADFD